MEDPEYNCSGELEGSGARGENEQSRVDRLLEEAEPMEHPARDIENEHSEPYPDQERVRAFLTIKDELGIEPSLVYEPGAGINTSSAVAFCDSKVVLSDVEEEYVKALREHGYAAIVADGESQPLSDEPDITVYWSVDFDEALSEQQLESDNVIANNWVGSGAERIDSAQGYEFVGCVAPGETDFVRSEEIDDFGPQDAYVFRNKK